VIAALVLCYAAFYWLLFVKLELFTRTPRNISIFAGIGVVLIGGIVFTWLTVAPTTKDGRMFQFVIQIVPNVHGTVVAVPVEPLAPVAKGDVLYRIDPTPFQAAVDRLEATIEQTEAQEKLAQIQVERNRKLVKAAAGKQVALDRWIAELASAQASLKGLEAQLRQAEWELDESVVRAPHSGYVFNLQVRPGTFVTNSSNASAMAFVSDERREVVATFSQSAVRLIEAGNAAEVVFATVPGRVFSGTVRFLAEATGSAQVVASGTLPTFTGERETGRYLVRVALDEDDADLLPQGAAGTVAVYTRAGKPVHVITKVVMRMHAWMGYLTNPG
jgi:RND family efflux transporter MFP subunit